MTPTSPSEISSPMGNIPYEILREIFIRCLPYLPFQLDCMQPNAAAAPMLLCHICSSWRSTALEYPMLWSHLVCSLTIINDSFSPAFALITQLEFLRWWKTNNGSIAPFIHLVIQWQGVRTSTDKVIRLDSAEARFLPEYLTSAQYLKSNSIYWGLAQQWKDIGHQVHHPNLHTMVVKRQWFRNDAFYDFEALVGSHCRQTPPLLRRLSISNGEVPCSFLIPSHWSALTHISMGNATFSLKFWFSLMRSVPCLQWAYFDIRELTEAKYYKEPMKHTLHHLSTFFVHCYQEHSNFSEPIAFPLTLLFKNLHLPTLHTLFLSSYKSSWNEGTQGIAELYGVLKSSPAVTTIALGDGFLPFGGCHGDITHSGAAPAEQNAVGPVWSCIPRLTNLLLELPNTSFCEEGEAVCELDAYLNKTLFKSGWLGLDAPACPLGRITFVDNYSCQERFNSLRDSGVMSLCIRRHAEKASRVIVEVVSYSERRAASQLHREWGLRV